MDIKTINLLSTFEVARRLNISVRRFDRLVKKYQIPHQRLSCGKVFLLEDIGVFQESRQDKLKHGG